MNRLSTENLVEPITKDLEIQLQTPFLLYKNAKYEITGVWFYEESECTRIAKKLELLVKGESTRQQPKAQAKADVDILSLLTKAHGEYEQKGKGSDAAPVSSSSGIDVVRPTAVRATSNGVNHSTALTVADLFSTTETMGPVPMPLHSGGSLFERLSILSVGTPTGVPPPNMPNTELHTAQNLERELRGKVKSKNNNGAAEPTLGQSLGRAAPVRPSTSATVLSHPQVSEIVQHNASGTPPRNMGLQSVALMSPMMFSAVANEHPPSYAEANRNQTPVQHQHSPFIVKSEELPTFHTEHEPVTPMTKAQLMQAFNHLLKNDPNFITQLHDAYVQSLKQSLRVNQ